MTLLGFTKEHLPCIPSFTVGESCMNNIHSLKTSPPPPVLERVQAAMIPILECVYNNIHNHSPGITGENNMTFLDVVEFPLDCA